MERNNKYDKYFNENMTERQADLTFFKTMKEIPHEEVQELFDAWRYICKIIDDKKPRDPNIFYCER